MTRDDLGPLFDLIDAADPDPQVPYDAHAPAPPPPDATIADARAYVRAYAVAQSGCHCPACDRLVRMYRYPISRSQAQFLVALALASARAYDGRLTGYTDLRTVGGQFSAGMRLGGKYAKLRHWGLIAAHPDQRATWKLTPHAIDWMRGRTLVPKYVYLLDNELHGYSSDMTTFDDALRRPFDLDDALRAPDGLTRPAATP